ncbi:MAG: carbon-nitrogen hydrolase family protein [Anaerovoracaceae bacterium]|jgi:predicted amidohydrolase
MKIALAQMKMTADAQENLQHSLGLLRQAAERGADLIMYPEVQLSPFFAQFEKSDERAIKDPYVVKEGGPELTAFLDACRENSIMASPNFYYEERGRKFDTSFLIDKEGRLLGTQKMVHIAQAEQFYEQDYYTPSDDGFIIFDTEFGKMAIVVCFDRHYPESVRTEAVRGAELILVPTANTMAEPMELFEQEIRVQSFQSSCYIAMCNRTGLESDMDFAGESILTDPDGVTVAKAGAGEELLIADVDFEKVRAVRSKRPYLSLRRTDLYE